MTVNLRKKYITKDWDNEFGVYPYINIKELDEVFKILELIPALITQVEDLSKRVTIVEEKLK